MLSHYTIPIFIPMQACPNECVFCNQHKITDIENEPTLSEVKKKIENYLNTIPKKNSIIEIGFFGGSFTGLPKSKMIDYLSITESYIQSKKISGIRLSTRPDYINSNILELLKKYNVSTIEIGAQSFDDTVLQKSGRGHNANDIINSSAMIKEYKIDLGIQMITGLPGDNLDKSINTAEKIIECGASHTRIYPTLVIKDTQLENLYLNNQYNPLSLTEAVEWVSELYLIFEKNNIKIIRVGLHPSEGLLSNKTLIAGPFHQSFKELVLTNLWKKKFELLESKNKSNIEITVSPKQLAYAVGYNSENKKTLENRYNSVKFKIDNNIKGRDYHVIHH